MAPAMDWRLGRHKTRRKLPTPRYVRERPGHMLTAEWTTQTRQRKCRHEQARAMTGKTDFKRELDAYRARAGEFRLVDVPALQYLMIDGYGDPNTEPAYRTAIETLYPLAYTLKFLSKRELGRDYTVMPLEGLWWAEDMSAFTVARDKTAWSWTLLIMTPEWIGPDLFAAGVEALRQKSRKAAKALPPRLGDVRLETLSEGRCVQTLHIGRYDDEAEVLSRMHEEFIPGQGLRMTGTHHEIYLSDARRTAPEKLRTILRQPVEAL